MTDAEQAARDTSWKLISIVHRDWVSMDTPMFKAFCDGWNAARDFYQGQWVPVSERLPAENGPYLFTFAFHKDDIQFGGKRVTEELYYADGMWFVNADDYESDPISGQPFDNSQYIAWMPLPPPYQPKTEPEDV